MTDKKPYEFNYAQYKQSALKVEQLDQMASSFFQPTTTWPAMIWAGLKLVVAVAYIIARHKMLEAQELVEKQEYQRRMYQQTDDSLNNDDLDGQRGQT